jgi:GT2 family glycosyltransferase
VNDETVLTVQAPVARTSPAFGRDGPVPPLPLPAGHASRVEESRRRLLAAIGDDEDLTFVRSAGNLGDELIWAGTRRLLSGRRYREVGLADVASVSGRTALLAGGGAWCGPFHELLPQVLPVLEERFRRVVVLPSSFDPSADEVRTALSRTKATVFAREIESFRRIEGLCEAGLAHDAAFFFDFAPWRISGQGALEAWRTDRESAGAFPVPPGNVDVSTALSSLDEWLWTLARYAAVRTDRAHVMIAAALLGKRVAYASSSYHKVPAIAEWALRDFPIERLEAPPRAAPPARPLPSLAIRHRILEAATESFGPLARKPVRGRRTPRVTIVILSWNGLDHTLAALRSVEDHVRDPFRLLVVDNASRPEVRHELERRRESLAPLQLLLLDRNYGASGGRQRALAQVATEYVMFLDNDAVLLPGTVEHLVAALDANPDALAATPRVVLPDGRIQHFGGTAAEAGGVVSFRLLGAGVPFDDPSLGPSGPVDWVAGTAFLARRSAFDAFPLDPWMTAYFEDNEWCWRISRSRPGAFRRCHAALAVHHQVPKDRTGGGAPELARTLRFVQAISRFYQVHGLVLEALFGFVPELVSPSGERRIGDARRLLEQMIARGPGPILESWVTGGFASVLGGGSGLAGSAVPSERDELKARLDEIHRSRWWRAANAYWSFRRRARGVVGKRPGR